MQSCSSNQPADLPGSEALRNHRKNLSVRRKGKMKYGQSAAELFSYAFSTSKLYFEKDPVALDMTQYFVKMAS